MRRNRWGVVAVSLLTLAACDGGEAEEARPVSTTASSPPSTVTAVPRLTACEDLPHPWRKAHVTSYRWMTRTVTFTWEDSQTATLRDTDPGCDSQPGIEGALRSHREGYLATQKVDCQRLRHLVEAVIEERQVQGKPTSGVGRDPCPTPPPRRHTERTPRWRGTSSRGRSTR